MNTLYTEPDLLGRGQGAFSLHLNIKYYNLK